MKKYFPMVMFLGVLLMLSGCPKRQPQVVVAPAANSEKMIDMQATSYSFTPNNIKAEQGDTILFNITNVSDTAHNFTLKDPEGKTIQEVDLPAKKTTPVRVTFAESGKYEFYCNKPFHSTLGMKGRVEVGAPSR